MVVSCSITHATPASFYAHKSSRASVEEIAQDLLKSGTDVFIGGGKDHFTKRKDGANLIDNLRLQKYQVADSLPAILKIKSGKLAGFIADEEPARASKGRAGQLLNSAKSALDILSKNQKGFFLMIEGSQIDWGGHDNDTDYVTDEMIDFDKAIGAALDFAEKDKNTLVIITGDHETGGMAITSGNTNEGKVEARFNTKSHTGVMIPVFAFGPGAESFSGIYDNTDIFSKMMNAFGFKK